MSERRHIQECADRALNIEQMSPEKWRYITGLPNFRAYMDEYLTAKCVTDLWWFLRFGVYYRAMKHYDVVLHQEVCRWLMNWTREVNGLVEPIRCKWLIMARELCKTQILICADAWEYVRDPDACCLLRAYDEPQAYKISNGVMDLITMPEFERRFPWCRPARKRSGQYEKWMPELFLLDRSDRGKRVYSMEAFGVKGEPTGGHYKFSHYDDYEVRKNAKSDKERETMMDVWKNDNNLHQAGSRRRAAGTPWSELALVYGVLERCNSEELENHNYDVFRMPCKVQVFDHPFKGLDNPSLLGDRRTIHSGDVVFPTVEANLECCQARVTFEPPEIKDTIVETREIVWNDNNHFRVNRPFPEYLGKPISFEVGTEKPSCPIRQTLDDIDYTPEIPDVELPPIVLQHLDQPGVEVLNERNSLPEKRREEGAAVFAQQNMLQAVPSEQLILNTNDLKFVHPGDIPEGERRYYRTTDFATAKRNRRNPAQSVFLTGFLHYTGAYICHVLKKEVMSTNAKLLEWCIGPLRVMQWGYKLKATSIETASNVENTMVDLFPEVEHDPYRYFTNLKEKRPFEGGMTYVEYADKYFRDKDRVRVPRKELPRKQSKIDRIDGSGSFWERGQVHILTTCNDPDAVTDESDTCTREGDGSFDCLDCLADLLTEWPWPGKPKAPRKEEEGVNVWDAAQKRAAELNVLSGSRVNPGWSN